MSFWNDFKNTNTPIVGLSPMDGITDAVFRLLIAKYGHADISVTEFVNIDGIYFSRDDIFKEFLYHEIERPVVAQIYGKSPELFYMAAQIVAELGFDGLDINMGCPARKVASRGSGAGLINTPELAQKIIAASKQGIADWVANGINSEIISKTDTETEKATDTAPNFSTRALRKLAATKAKLKDLGVKLPDYSLPANRKTIPVSVKTRIGYLKNEINTWIPKLIEAQPAAIQIHGRTFKQLYTGKADWDAIGAAAKLVHEHNQKQEELNKNLALPLEPILILGNGDVSSREQALALCKQYSLDGILIGRATWGDPWVFLPQSQKPGEQDWQIKVPMILDHVRIHEQMFPQYFYAIRKHLAWYFKGFDGAAELRQQLMQSNSAAEVEQIISTTKGLTR